MIYPIKMDIIPMLQHFVESLMPFAAANFVELSFHSEVASMDVTFRPEELLSSLAQILCRVITFTPSGYAIRLVARVDQDAHNPQLEISIENTGVNLANLSEAITRDLKLTLSSTTPGPRKSSFDQQLPTDPDSYTAQGAHLPEFFQGIDEKEPVFFKKLLQRMQTHALNMQRLEEAVSKAHDQRDQVFLKKVNALILANIDREDFGVEMLAQALALSRTQVYRRFKSLIRMSPSRYIRLVRLQKAKEYLEKTEMSVSEACFRVGFIDKSHFARAFYQQFGFNPSYLKNDKKNG